MSNYLAELTTRLASGVGMLPDEVRQSHAEYFKAAQQTDGGFAGREGGSDLYYTGFALRALSILGELYGDVAEATAQFVRSKLSGQESIVDFFSLIYSAGLLNASAGIDVFEDSANDWRQQVAIKLEQLRREDGGYAKAIEGQASSTYHTFLVVLCLELIEQPMIEPNRIAQFLFDREADEGGFLEIRVSKRAGTNPTAAAIATLQILGHLDQELKADTIEFLCHMQSDEGGLQANTRIPFADLLSTFTGLLTLTDIGGATRLNIGAVNNFVQKMQLADGGFQAGSFDHSHDVEYSFYGLGCLALLAQM